MRESGTTARLGSSGSSTARALYVFVDGDVAVVPLPAAGELIIGRASTAAVRVDHPTVSRHHAALHVGTHLAIEDLGGANGTRVGGVALERGRRVLVARGAPIEIGAALLVVRAPHENSPSLVAATDGTHAAATGLERTLRTVAASDLPVLVLGEVGAGKEVTVERLHALGPRPAAPLVRVRCATLARPDPELFRQARAGTLMLDEIVDLSVSARGALTSLLDDAPKDVRVVTTTSRDIDAAVDKGMLSRELFHRIDGLRIVVPPLRARVREIESLAMTFIARAAAEKRTPAPILTPDALRVLTQHPWPGNVRELQNAIARATLLCPGRVLTDEHLRGFIAPPRSAIGAGPTLADAVTEAEYKRIVSALAQCHGNQTKAAKLLGISRGTLLSRMDRYRVPRPRKD